MPVLGVSNPFRSKWRHRSSTTEISDTTPKVVPENSQSTQKNLSSEKSKANSDNKGHSSKKKSTKEPPFNSDSLLCGIGNYIFKEPLGDGKFSKVMLATHYSTGEEVAIKMINKRAYDYRVMYRLVREVGLMEVLNHENIVRLHETYETADALYIIMEYVAGVNLEEYLKSIIQKNAAGYTNALSEDKARDIFRQLVKAVDHCHSKWVVHRDLKAPNVLLDSSHNVKLADFGLGNRYGLHRLNTICGSMLYYSPEIISSRPYVGPEVDCWCLGIILFRMTAGFEPFAHAKSVPELTKYVTNQQYIIPPHLSSELQQTIKKCLSKERYERLSVRSCLKDDPWLNKSGHLDDVFDMDQHEGEAGENEQTYHARDITASYVEYGRIEDKAKLQMVYKNSKIQCRRDLEDEKNKKVKVEKTVIYHMTNPSTYFTGAAPHTSRAPIDLDAQDKIRNEMREHIIFTLKQVRLQQIQNSHLTDMKSPISHIFRKLKRTEPASIKPQSSHSQLRKAASALNISQLYQRVAKDQISYFTIQCNVRTDSATTVVSGVSNTPASIFVPPEYNKGKRFSVSSVNVRQQQQPQQQKHTNTANGSDGHRRLSHRVSMAFMSSSTSGLNVQEEEHCKQNIIEMIKIIRKVCELLGITYYQSSSSQLSCLLTLRNYKKRITQQQPHSPIRQQQSLSNASNNTQYSSGANNSSHSLFISKFFTSNDRLSDMNKQHASNISKNSHASSASSGWWSRQVHRISAQFNSQSIVTGSGIIVGNSSHDLLAMGRQTQEEQIKLEIDDKDSVEDGSGGHALFTIDVSSIHKQQNEDDELPVYVIALKYSKSSGSNTVFKFAKGWIQNILCDQHATNEEVFNRAMEEENIKLAQYQKYYNGETVTAI